MNEIAHEAFAHELGEILMVAGAIAFVLLAYFGTDKGLQ